MNTKLAAVLCVAVFPCLAQVYEENQESVPKEMISKTEENVQRRLRQIYLTEGVQVFSEGEKGEGVFAFPILVDGQDRLWDDIHQKDSKVWIKNPAFATRLIHGKCLESWRMRGNTSLHVIVCFMPDDGRRFYKIHIDKWAPHGFKTPFNSPKHIVGEWLWNVARGKSTDQRGIEQRLDKIDRRVFQLKGRRHGLPFSFFNMPFRKSS